MKKGRKVEGHILKFAILTQAHNSRYSDTILISVGKPLGLSNIEFILPLLLVFIPHM